MAPICKIIPISNILFNVQPIYSYFCFSKYSPSFFCWRSENKQGPRS